ncbi:MAG: multiubiquitin domain-containing protein [Patescibacteria group bacterium]|nr:multiubiquitin domain-containing protein [Patescibacteria group bacterium]
MSAESKQHKFEIIVNAQKRPWNEDKISYSQVVELAFPGHNPKDMFTVQYSKGPKDNPQGTLAQGQSVEIKNEMIFNVTQTIQS